MKVEERAHPQFQAYCEACDIRVSAWYSDRPTIERLAELHERLHRDQDRVGKSIRAVDYP